ncbi:MAG: AbrB/MazE/SpoVT family DNA-binding domain-containing protein [Methanotrichaceae archaeon]
MREYTATVKIDRQMRVTIPKPIREKENLHQGDVVEIVIRIKDFMDEQTRLESVSA